MLLFERKKFRGLAFLSFAVGLGAGIVCKDSYLPDSASRVYLKEFSDGERVILHETSLGRDTVYIEHPANSGNFISANRYSKECARDNAERERLWSSVNSILARRD